MSNEIAKLKVFRRCPQCLLWHEDLHAQIPTVWVNGVEYSVPEKQPTKIEVRHAN